LAIEFCFCDRAFGGDYSSFKSDQQLPRNSDTVVIVGCVACEASLTKYRKSQISAPVHSIDRK
jgi:hypothetical protein